MLELNLAPSAGSCPTARSCSSSSRTRRSRGVGDRPDRIEREGAGFRRRVADGYRELADLFPERIVALDGALPADELAEEVHG